MVVIVIHELIRALFEEGKVPAATAGLEKWRREYNEGVVTDLDRLMADIEERVAAMDREREETVEAADKVRSLQGVFSRHAPGFDVRVPRFLGNAGKSAFAPELQESILYRYPA